MRAPTLTFRFLNCVVLCVSVDECQRVRRRVKGLAWFVRVCVHLDCGAGVFRGRLVARRRLVYVVVSCLVVVTSRRRCSLFPCCSHSLHASVHLDCETGVRA